MPDDIGYEQTEKLIHKLIGDIDQVYSTAAKEMKAKADDYFRRFEIKDKIWRQAVEDGTKTEEAYIAWRKQQMLVGKRWNAMVEKLSKDAVTADMKAASTIKGYMPEAYALNHNYGTYMIEQDGQITTSYTLYNAETVERLWRDDPQLLPDPAPESETARLLKENKDLRWNRAHIRQDITQAVIQGKDITDISKSLMHTVGMDKRSAITNARTMMTSAQNGGRNDSFIRAATMGVRLTCEWLSTLDERTRTSHRLLNGQRKAVNEPFRVYDEIVGAMVEIYYPGDMGGKQYKVPADMLYNCRCAIVAWVKGFEPNDFVKSSPKMGDMTYEEWLQATPKPQKLTAPEEKAQAAKAAYIREYKEMAGGSFGSSTTAEKAERTPAEPIFKDIHANFTPAKTVEEAEQYARNTFVDSGFYKLTGKDVSYKGIDVETANTINGRLNDIYSQFDIDKLSSLEAFGKSNKKIFEKHSGAPMMTTNYGNIGLNNTLLKDKKTIQKYIDDGEKSFKYVVENADVLKGSQRELAETYKQAGRSLVGNSVEDMVTHEVGHHISYMSAVNKEMSKISGSNWRDYAQNLSGYSNHSFGEYVAESFNAYYNGEYGRLQPEIKAIFDNLRKKQ